MTRITPIDYSSRDFDSLLADLQTAAPLLLPEWTNQSDLDFGTVLLDLFAYVGDIMSYYIDRVANEAFLATATRRQSVLNIAEMLNYTPVARAAAQATLTFTLVAGAAETTIPALTQVATVPQAGVESVIFETDEELVITDTGTVAATQGVTYTDEILTSNATGAASQEYTLYNTSVIDGSITVTVTDAALVSTTWLEIDNLLNAVAASRAYEIVVDENDVTHVIFGDNVLGLAPSAGSVITATYRVGVGTQGNVAAGQLTEIVDPISGVQSVTNASSASGGADEESLESIRVNIPKSLFALQRAVTLKDYEALALQVSGIAKAQATATVYTSVLLYVAPVGVGGDTATGPDTTAGTQKYTVQRYFDDKKMVNVTITLADPTYVDINISATVYVLANYYSPTVKNAVTAALESLLAYNNVDFGQDITISQVYHAIQNTEGVDYCTLATLVRSDSATLSGAQTVAINDGEIPEPGTITLTMSGGVQ